MRVRTDARRREILDAAVEVFREMGYERASMIAISDRLGGSKGTLYRYFPSKRELFAAAIMKAVDEQGDRAFELLDPSEPDGAAVLRRFGEIYLDIVMADDVIALTRTSIGDCAHHDLRGLQYRQGTERIVDALTAYFTQHWQGTICAVEPRTAAIHLIGLLDSGIVLPLLFGAEPEFTRKKAVSAAVGAFLRAYAVDASSSGGDFGSP